MNVIKLFIVVNVDWFFLSHRLPIAVAAKAAGYDVTIISSDTGKSEIIRGYGFKFMEVPFKRSGTNPLHELKCLRILKNIYKRYRPDIVHHVTIKVALYGSIAARLSSVSNVVNAISGLGYNFTGERKGPMQALLLKMMKYGFRRQTTHFIFQNADDIDVFKDLKIVRESQISLIKGSGVDLQKYCEFPPPQTDKITVLLSARLLYDKGIIEYIEAARQLESEFVNNVQFLLAGDFDNENLASIDKGTLLPLVDGIYVKWVGFKSNMLEALKEADIVVLPSYREGLPKSLIEAAAVGRPIVTTNVTGCRDCVIEGYNGFLVPKMDSTALAAAIRKLLIDKEQRVFMGHNSRLLAEKEFSIINVVDRTLEIYANFFIESRL